MSRSARTALISRSILFKKKIYHCFEHVYTQHMYTYCKILHIMNMYIFINKKTPLNIAVRSDSVNIAVRSDSVNIAVNPKKKITLDYFLYRDQYFSELAFFFSSNSTRALMACRSSLRILLVVLLPYHLHDCRSCVRRRWHWRWRQRRRGHLPLGATLQ